MSSDSNYDLVVVGCGGAGLSAAVSYAEAAKANGREANIAVLERAAEPDRGGSTRWTMAGMYVDQNFKLNPRFVGWMQEVSKGLADLDYCLTFESEVPNTGKFLRDHGVEFMVIEDTFEGEPQVYNMPNGGGHSIVNHLADSLAEHPGAKIHYETEAVRLSISDEGRVNGVVVRGPDGLLKTMHGDAVVLACGGFEGNYEMLTQYCGKDAVDLRVLAPGTQYNKGDGIRMATEIGAATSGQFDGMHAELVDIRTDRADPVLYGHNWTIVVNGEAKRFYDEGAKNMGDSFELIAYEVWANQNQQAFFITDQFIFDQPELTARFDTDIPPVKADTIRDLANQLGLDPDALEATVNEFNASANDNEFDPKRYDGKSTSGIEPPKSNWAFPVNHPPYYGYPVAAAICFTYGGLKTDTEARVLSKGGKPIPGLYAAGELVGLYYHEYKGGTSVLKACTFGRIAGAHAEANAAVTVTAR
ncbi:MAG: FAD-dependent oxidoreductase [Actinobacteria bacterium]|nr:FAD-dependent oxidoreductase [Actinomycetota bacterium]